MGYAADVAARKLALLVGEDWFNPAFVYTTGGAEADRAMTAYYQRTGRTPPSLSPEATGPRNSPRSLRFKKRTGLGAQRRKRRERGHSEPGAPFSGKVAIRYVL